jgi:hypothetical protein
MRHSQGTLTVGIFAATLCLIGCSPGASTPPQKASSPLGVESCIRGTNDITRLQLTLGDSIGGLPTRFPRKPAGIIRAEVGQPDHWTSVPVFPGPYGPDPTKQLGLEVHAPPFSVVRLSDVDIELMATDTVAFDDVQTLAGNTLDGGVATAAITEVETDGREVSLRLSLSQSVKLPAGWILESVDILLAVAGRETAPESITPNDSTGALLVRFGSGGNSATSLSLQGVVVRRSAPSVLAVPPCSAA